MKTARIFPSTASSRIGNIVNFWPTPISPIFSSTSFGVSAIPTECIDLKLQFSYFEADETIDGGWWFWRWAGDQDEGLEAGLYADYRYSADLLFRAGYAHFFAR